MNEFNIIDCLRFQTMEDEQGNTYCQVIGCLDKRAISISIPETYKNISVTSIGRNAFENCDNLTEIIIPSSVINIELDAFSGCDQLADAYFHGGLWITNKQIYKKDFKVYDLKGIDHLLVINISPINPYPLDNSKIAAFILTQNHVSLKRIDQFKGKKNRENILN